MSHVIEVASCKDPPMSDPFDFIGGILLGTFLDSFAALIYYVRQIRQEARQNYAEVLTLERTLEIHRRNLVRDVPSPIEHLAAAEHAPSNEILLIPPWIGNGEDPAGRINSEKLQEFTGES